MGSLIWKGNSALTEGRVEGRGKNICKLLAHALWTHPGNFFFSAVPDMMTSLGEGRRGSWTGCMCSCTTAGGLRWRCWDNLSDSSSSGADDVGGSVVWDVEDYLSRDFGWRTCMVGMCYNTSAIVLSRRLALSWVLTEKSPWVAAALNTSLLRILFCRQYVLIASVHMLIIFMKYNV